MGELIVLNKQQLESELADRKKWWERSKQRIEDMKTGKIEKNCTESCIEYALSVEVSLLQNLLDKYYAPREYLKCAHCKSRILLTPDVDPKIWTCPNRHLNVNNEKLHCDKI